MTITWIGTRTRKRPATRAELERARLLWRMGYVSPLRITRFLDVWEVDGPEVDKACGVAEPRVDEWEAGKVYPTFEQLCALAEFIGIRPDLLCIQPGQMNSYLDTSMRWHTRRGEQPTERPWFSVDVIGRTPGTEASGYRP